MSTKRTLPTTVTVLGLLATLACTDPAGPGAVSNPTSPPDAPNATPPECAPNGHYNTFTDQSGKRHCIYVQ